MYSPSRRIHYIPNSPKSFMNSKDRGLDHPVDLNNNNNNNNNNDINNNDNNNNNNNNSDCFDKEVVTSVNSRKLLMTPPPLGKRSPYSEGQHSPSYFERKSPLYSDIDRASSPVYAERLDTATSHHQQLNSPNFRIGSMAEQRSPRLPHSLPPVSRKTSESSSISPKSVKSNSNKEEKTRSTTPPMIDADQDTLTIDPVDMLIKLFPLQQVFTLRDALKNHNNDPVRTIEYLLYGKASSPNGSTRKSSIPSYCQKSEGSRNDQKKNMINDDLSTLAKAYDIPVSEDRIITSKIVNW